MGGTPIAGWFIMENPRKMDGKILSNLWMIGGTPFKKNIQAGIG